MKNLINMKNLFILLIPFISFSQDYSRYMNKISQEKNGKIYGKVKDEKSQNMQYANISLIKNDSIVEGLISDEKGRFLFEKIEIGDYNLIVSFVGYENVELNNISLTNTDPIFNTKTIVLNPSSNMLEETNLIDEKPIYENKFEKIVYNVENDLSQNSLDGVDVLTQAPLLDVDMEGNVSLRGSRNIKFLINGKESSFLKGGNVSDVLKMIPSEQIKSVEVITSPTARYAGEGNAGIVNIITKQDKLEGFTAGVNTSTGTRVNRTGANFSFGNKKFGISGRVGGRYGWPRKGNSTYSREVKNESGIFERNLEYDGSTIGNWVGHNSSLDAYYEINPQLNILSSFWYGGYRKTNEGEYNYISFSNGFEEYNTFQESLNTDTELEWTTDIIKKFLNNDDRELRFAFQLGGNFDNDESTSLQGFSLSQDSLAYENMSDGNGKEYTFQFDYVHPFLNKQKIEVGGKIINRITEVDYSNSRKIYETQAINISNNLSSEIFNYNQSVWAGYLSTSVELPSDLSLITGLRYEGTKTNGNFEVLDSLINENTYHTFLPSFVLSKKLSFSKTLKFSYSKRLMRPDLTYVNPNLVYSDFRNVRVGNPNLNPEISHQLEIGFSSFKPGFMTSYFIYYKKTTDIIEQFLTFQNNDEISIIRYENVGTNNSFGLNLFGSIKIPNIINIRVGGDVYTYNISSYDNILNENNKDIRIVHKWYLRSTVDLGKNYSFECRGSYRSPRQTIQGKIPSFSMVGFSFKKEFNNKRGSIGLGLIEPWSKYKSFRTDLSTGNINQSSNNQILFRSIQINFKYKFGKLKFNPIKEKSTINNNDLKQNDSGGEY